MTVIYAAVILVGIIPMVLYIIFGWKGTLDVIGLRKYNANRNGEVSPKLNKENGVPITMEVSGKKVLSSVGGLLAFMVIWMSFFTVEEGHVGIVKRFSEARYQVNPGLHFKVPFIDSVEEIEVRTRKNVESMLSSSSEQMPLTVEVSVNWTVERDSALDLFKRYGGLNQFEQRILDPRFRSVTKNILPQFSAEQLIQDRASAIRLIEGQLIEEMAEFPVGVDNIQIENIVLPPRYIESIETKQRELNLAAAEQHKLERQRLESLRQVNTAEAQAQSIVKVAEAEAQATRLRGEAEASSIEARGAALRSNPLIVDLTEAERWDGALPTMMTGEGTLPILDMRQDND
ncbi:prohibitin family protein [uncultured Umboniibacter sp.]|uniref:prohibitin family protein n=1 Tax=uncultured Umboniibacter sp. TaxID=1798917 RepID=UPI0026094434|nr:prohibitin family protein [uncultured Umboniibacter sp.]